MAITAIGSTMGGAINGNNVTLTYPAASSATAGDYVLVSVVLGTSKGTTLSVASSSGGTVYSQIVSTIASSFARFGVFRLLLTSTMAYTQAVVTGTGGSTDSTATAMHIFRGVDTTTPEDATATSTTGNSGSPDSPSITVASCSDAIISAVGWALSANALTAPSSFVNSVIKQSTDTRPSQIGQAWITNGTTSAFNPNSWTSTAGSAGWCAATIALKPIVSSAEQWTVVMAGPDISSQVDEQRRTVVRSY